MTRLVIDAPYLCYRAKYSTGQMSYQDDLTGVVYGFLRDVSKLSIVFSTTDFVFCFDSPTSKRKKLFVDYKKSRTTNFETMSKEERRETRAFRKQVKELKEKWLPKIGFKNCFEVDGYEADDLIAQVCLDSTKHVTIVSSDKDLLQCLRRRKVDVWCPRTGLIITADSFREEYGVPPQHWARVKAIAGCSTDDVPGVVGVGEKTAVRYLRHELNEKSKKFQDIKNNQRIIHRNLDLVRLPLDDEINLPKIKKCKPSKTKWNHVCRKLGIRALLHNG